MKRPGKASDRGEDGRLLAAVPQPDITAAEPALVRAAQGGDLRAFESLYRTHVGRVYGLCLRMSGSPDRAEELAQDVFVRAWRKLETFEGRSAFGSWLYRMAANAAIDARRSEIRRSAREVGTEDPSGAEPIRTAPGPEAGMDLDRAVAALPAGARAVFVLHDVEGYRHHEIAEMLGVAAGTCKAQLHRARKLLRETLR